MGRHRKGRRRGFVAGLRKATYTDRLGERAGNVVGGKVIGRVNRRRVRRGKKALPRSDWFGSRVVDTSRREGPAVTSYGKGTRVRDVPLPVVGSSTHVGREEVGESRARADRERRASREERTMPPRRRVAGSGAVRSGYLEALPTTDTDYMEAISVLARDFASLASALEGYVAGLGEMNIATQALGGLRDAAEHLGQAASSVTNAGLDFVRVYEAQIEAARKGAASTALRFTGDV